MVMPRISLSSDGRMMAVWETRNVFPVVAHGFRRVSTEIATMGGEEIIICVDEEIRPLNPSQRGTS